MDRLRRELGIAPRCADAVNLGTQTRLYIRLLRELEECPRKGVGRRFVTGEQYCSMRHRSISQEMGNRRSDAQKLRVNLVLV